MKTQKDSENNLFKIIFFIHVFPEVDNKKINKKINFDTPCTLAERKRRFPSGSHGQG